MRQMTLTQSGEPGRVIVLSLDLSTIYFIFLIFGGC